MQYRRLGSTGLRTSALGLGSWNTIGTELELPGSIALMDEAYQAGINYFDTAETYADGLAEQVMGSALRELGWDRETFLISGKVFWGVHGRRPNTWGLSRKHLMEGCEATLRRLQLDHVDVLLCHRSDPGTPLSETVSAMSDLIRQGKILYWGTSEWPADLVTEARRIATERGDHLPMVEQVQHNLLFPHRVDDFSQLHAEGLGLTTWSPLAHGLLAGRYSPGAPPGGRLDEAGNDWLRAEVFGDDREGVMAKVATLIALAQKRGIAPATLALAWVLRDERVSSAVCGASDPAHLTDQLRALDLAPELDDDLVRELDAVAVPRSPETGESS